jgi:hypothetical protein
MADAADDQALSALAPLPHAVVLLIFLLLPVDLRARCACVCSSWRAALSERFLWTRLDVSHTSGNSVVVTDALLRGAAARAGGALHTLDVSGSVRVSHDALLLVATANAATLHELRVCHGACDSMLIADGILLQLGDAEVLLRAAPHLRVLDADVDCISVAEARRVLCANEGLLTPLCVHGLRVRHGNAAEADVLALAAHVASHSWLQELCLHGALTPAALDAMMVAGLAQRLTSVQLAYCNLSAAMLPALARLLGGGAVNNLYVWHEGFYPTAPFLETHAAVLASALRANTVLTSLQLFNVQLWRDAATAKTLLGALTSHASLRILSVLGNDASTADRPNAGAALGALLAANAPALTELDVSNCNLGDAGMAPLFEALPANTHLRTLKCSGNRITGAFAAAVLLPAVRANASLRDLATTSMGVDTPALREAEAIVNGRAAAR